MGSCGCRCVRCVWGGDEVCLIARVGSAGVVGGGVALGGCWSSGGFAPIRDRSFAGGICAAHVAGCCRLSDAAVVVAAAGPVDGSPCLPVG